MTEEFTAVARPQDEMTANIIKSALEDAGIAAVAHAYSSSVFDGIFTNTEGAWGEVVVSPADAERALVLLKDYAEQTGQAQEE